MLALKNHKLDAWIDGDSLLNRDRRIQITNIQAKIEEKATFKANAAGHGRRLETARRESCQVTIEFTIFEWRSVYERDAVLDAANAWARDGFLEISTKLGRRLYMICAGRAWVKQARDHNEKYMLVFESAENPFWEDKSPTRITLSGTNAVSHVSVPGTRECAPVDVEVTPVSDTLNTLILFTGSSYMTFENLNVAPGAGLILSHDGHGVLSITAGGASRYACRTGISADDLICGPGVVACGFSSDAACGVEFAFRGRYL